MLSKLTDQFLAHGAISAEAARDAAHAALASAKVKRSEISGVQVELDGKSYGTLALGEVAKSFAVTHPWVDGGQLARAAGHDAEDHAGGDDRSGGSQGLDDMSTAELAASAGPWPKEGGSAQTPSKNLASMTPAELAAAAGPWPDDPHLPDQ